MNYFVLEVYTKFRGRDREYFEFSRDVFLDLLPIIDHLKYFPFEIDYINLKQYARNKIQQRTTLLNCFKVVFPGDNMIYPPKYEFVDVSGVL